MMIKRTNYEGDWGDTCPHCGESQETHKTILGEYEGVIYEHRMPCEQEKKKMTRERAHLVVMANRLVAGIYTAEYVAEKVKNMIPGWSEVQLLRKIVRLKLRTRK